MVYVLDSNFFIQAHRALYPFDVALTFWNKVHELASKQKIISIDKVKQEIYKNEDDLKLWCQSALPNNFFKDTSGIMSTQYPKVIKWAINRNHYTGPALTEFSDQNEADSFLIAYALDEPSTRIIVTQETSEPNLRKKVKIPEPCNALGVVYVNPMDMFRQLGETF